MIMKLTQLKCPACNATLRIMKENSSIAVCDYCGLQYLIETDAGGEYWVHLQGNSAKNAPKRKQPIASMAAGCLVVLFLFVVPMILKQQTNPKDNTVKKEQETVSAKNETKEVLLTGVFADMAEEVFHKSPEKITQEELNQFKWIILSSNKDRVQVGYSFKDPYVTKDAEITYLDFARADVVVDYSVLPRFLGLKKLELNGTLPNGALKGLQLIGLSCNAKDLQALADSLDDPKQLQELTIFYGLESLTGLSKFSGLLSFQIENARNLTELKELASLSKLQHLTLLSCDQVTDFSVLSVLSELKELQLESEGLKSINFLTSLEKLTKLSIGDADLLQVDELKKMKNLTCLMLEDMSNLQQVSGIETLTNLTELSLEVPYSCTNPDLSQLTSLKKLTISGMKETSFLRSLTKLNELELSSCEVGSSADFSKLTQLTSLKIRNIYGNLDKFSFLTQLPVLEALEIKGNVNYEDITQAFLIPTIKTLRLNGVEAALSLSKLKENSSLTKLYLDGVKLYENVTISYDGPFTMVDYDTIVLAKHLDILTCFPNLEILSLADNKLTDINALSGLRKLQQLNIKDNYITDLSPLASLNELKEVNCAGNGIENYRVLKESITILKE